MELLTINSEYTEDQLAIFLKHSIKYPKEGSIVELLRVENLRRIGKIGYIVSPFDNQWITDINYGVESSKEVSFDSRRFVHLDGTEVTKEEINEFKKHKEKEFIKITPKTKENGEKISNI